MLELIIQDSLGHNAIKIQVCLSQIDPVKQK